MTKGKNHAADSVFLLGFLIQHVSEAILEYSRQKIRVVALAIYFYIFTSHPTSSTKDIGRRKSMDPAEDRSKFHLTCP